MSPDESGERTSEAQSFVVATRNPDKLRELREALPGLRLDPLPDHVELPPEDGATFAENAAGKAQAAFEATGRPSLADDSGIEARALGGAPGVRSARYAGEGATDEENLTKLLSEVDRHDDRRVAYVCALVMVSADGRLSSVEGRCEGHLIEERRGSGGFGYDPAFVPVDGDGRTMAELTADEKHALSHRGRAARAMASVIRSQAGEGR